MEFVAHFDSREADVAADGLCAIWEFEHAGYYAQAGGAGFLAGDWGFSWTRSSGTYVGVTWRNDIGGFDLRLNGRRHSIVDMPGSEQLRVLLELPHEVVDYVTERPDLAVFATST